MQVYITPAGAQNTTDLLLPLTSAGFKALGAAILEYPLLASHCQFIFVPGPNDPWSSTTLPRPEIPATFTQYIRDKIPKATFTSNPARIQYFNQEIVIFREDLMGRMLRNLVSVKDEAGDMRRFVSAFLTFSSAPISPIYRSCRSWYKRYSTKHISRRCP